MLTNETKPRFEPGSRITCRATEAITGGRFVQVSGAREDGLITIKMADAGEQSFGVATHDAADGEVVTVLGGGFTVPVKCAADLTGGTEVEVGSAGQAIAKASGIAVGVAVDTIDGSPTAATGDIKLY